MHLLSATPGGFADSAAGVVRIQQDPADIVVLSAADTTLALLAAACRRLPREFPSVRLCNLQHLRQPASIDLYIDEVLRHARVVLVDHLGGESYWPYGTERLLDLARDRGQTLVMFSGDRTEDPNLLRKSTADASQCRQLWRYLRESGPDNALQFFRFVGREFLGLREAANPPKPFPEASIYSPAGGVGTVDDWRSHWQENAPVVALVFYRAHLASGNTEVFDHLIAALQRAGLNPLPLALNSLKDPLCLQVLRTLCAEHQAALILNTTSFSTAALDDPEPQPLVGDVPVLQVILSGGNREDWRARDLGLNPRDVAMQIALPEVDGRVITRAISFKGRAYRCERTQFEVSRYQADIERCEFVAELARRWCRLRSAPNANKRIALIMANYPARDGRIGNGVGLDTPASVISILRALRDRGYELPDIPADGAALMATLREGITNDPDTWHSRWAFQSLSLEDYAKVFAGLPAENRRAIEKQWGSAEQDPMLRQRRFMIAGFRAGNIFIGLQPTRGVGLDPYASYHSPDLVPPHHYLAFYFWLRQRFDCDAIVHVGKHGNLEWLPGKSVALSAECWPDLILGPLPHLYPFIVNDPGEGSQAKRRAQAVIVDHLMPPLTRAENYGPLQDLERQVDEYYEALVVDPRRADILRKSILSDVLARNLHSDLGLEAPQDAQSERALLVKTDAYLCELKESQIRDGLHVFGSSPQGAQRRDTLLALARFPVGDGKGARAGLLSALARDLQLGNFDPLDADWSEAWLGLRPALLEQMGAEPWRHCGDTRERLEKLALRLLEEVAGDARADLSLSDVATRDARAGLSLSDVATRDARVGPSLFDVAPRDARAGLSLSDVATRDARVGLPLFDVAPRDARAGLSLSDVATRDARVGLPLFDVTPGDARAGLPPCDVATRAARAGLSLSDVATRDASAGLPRFDEVAGDARVGQPLIDGAAGVIMRTGLPQTALVLERIHNQVRPALDMCGERELRGLIDGLNGRFVPAGPSGAPSRGRPDVLPTGRNFYSVDTRAIPTQTAWHLGFKSASQLIERYVQEHGEHPRAMGLSVWGTATMRTGGDDIAQALALLGVRPVWSAGSHRVSDFEILPVSILDRPRIDVTLRVSGFFRDAFANVIEVFDAAVQALAELDESAADNPIRARVLSDTAALIGKGLSATEARMQAGWRVFGSKPGAYGAGLQGLLDSGAWRSDAELATAYGEWGGYAYGRGSMGTAATARFGERLSHLQMVVQNQDNREHDLLDSSDYSQFQGGMIAAARHFGAREPAAYHGDHSNPAAPRIRSLKEEIGRVVRSRVVNPKWIAGIKRHGYKGAFEMAATVDYLFAFDATAHVLSDYQYEMVANAYVNDADTRDFLAQHNPDALRDICERMLEAIRRGLWEQPGPFSAQLEDQLLAAEALLEGGPS